MRVAEKNSNTWVTPRTINSESLKMKADTQILIFYIPGDSVRKWHRESVPYISSWNSALLTVCHVMLALLPCEPHFE